jgi:hypothetical protein
VLQGVTWSRFKRFCRVGAAGVGSVTEEYAIRGRRNIKKTKKTEMKTYLGWYFIVVIIGPHFIENELLSCE